jgi:limonene-1,2-epoxide hydrolase
MRDHFTRLLKGATALELQLRNIAETNNGVVFLERVDVFTYKGKEGALPVVAVLDIADGKVTAWREYYDRAALLREMGIEEGEH